MSVNIRGKEYSTVNERVDAFRRDYGLRGSIQHELIHNADGDCIFKCSIYVDGNLVAEGHAWENKGASAINRTSYVENCVPLDTQILTDRGWVYFHQLNIGDLVWSYNMETGVNEFCKVTGIHVYQKRPVVRLHNSRFDFTCTPAHKWITRSQYRGIRKKATEDLKASDKIVTAVKQVDTEMSDRGRMLGWLMCDCEINHTENGLPSTAYISQAKHHEDVSELFGQGRKVKKYDENWMDCYEWIVPAAKVREILGHFGIASIKDLAPAMSAAPLEDVAGCMRSMMLADGDNRGFSSTYKELVDAVQIMCARLGIATNHITSRTQERGTKPIYTLAIKSTDGAWCSELEVDHLPPRDVWCPTTENGTWCAKQGDFVAMTSNCETSACGRALAFLGYGIDGSIASADEVAAAIEQQSAPHPKPDYSELTAALEAYAQQHGLKLGDAKRAAWAKLPNPASQEDVDMLAKEYRELTFAADDIRF